MFKEIFWCDGALTRKPYAFWFIGYLLINIIFYGLMVVFVYYKLAPSSEIGLPSVQESTDDVEEWARSRPSADGESISGIAQNVTGSLKQEQKKLKQAFIVVVVGLVLSIMITWIMAMQALKRMRDIKWHLALILVPLVGMFINGMIPFVFYLVLCFIPTEKGNPQKAVEST